MRSALPAEKAPETEKMGKLLLVACEFKTVLSDNESASEPGQARLLVWLDWLYFSHWDRSQCCDQSLYEKTLPLIVSSMLHLKKRFVKRKQLQLGCSIANRSKRFLCENSFFHPSQVYYEEE